MQIVIDIPEEDYHRIASGFGQEEDALLLEKIFRNGKPLPEGHGDLIDKDDLLADSYPIDDWSGNEVNIVDVMSVKMADVIIEADKENG